MISNRLKVVTIIGTRPDIIKLSEIIKAFDVFFDHILVHTGQNYDYTLNQIFFVDLNLRMPDEFLNVVGDNLGQTMGNIISKSYELLSRIKPDAVFILGDTNSALSGISAKRLKIPLFHYEAGNRCFDENLPEEINRRIVDHISDVNLTFSSNAKQYLISEGIDKQFIFEVGSPMTEIVTSNLDKITNSTILNDLNIARDEFVLCSIHREENVDHIETFLSIMAALNRLVIEFNKDVVFSVHPRTRKKINELNISLNERIFLIDPVAFSSYCNLQINAYCVISDSGTLSEEASYFKFPAISIRTSTERPEGIEKGFFLIGNTNSDNILQSVFIAREFYNLSIEQSEVLSYTEKNVSSKIVKIIQGYVPIINKVVWRK
jgi:UDP-N-acetyl-L-fucosamine synthase